MSNQRKDRIIVRSSDQLAPATGNNAIDKTQVALSFMKEFGQIIMKVAETRHARVVAQMDIEKIAAETSRDVEQARGEVARLAEARLSVRERGQIVLDGLKHVTEQLNIGHLDTETRKLMLDVARDLLLAALSSRPSTGT